MTDDVFGHHLAGGVKWRYSLGPWTILYITVRRAVTLRSSSDCQPINYVRHTWLSSTVVSIQGHPTTVFAAVRIYVQRSKYYLEFSITWGRLKISRWLFDSWTIFEAYLINFPTIFWSLDCSQSPIFSWDRLDILRLTVTQSTRSRRSYGKIEDCEQSIWSLIFHISLPRFG